MFAPIHLRRGMRKAAACGTLSFVLAATLAPAWADNRTDSRTNDRRDNRTDDDDNDTVNDEEEVVNDEENVDERRRHRTRIIKDHDHSVCTPRIFYKRGHISPRNFFVPRTRFTDGPGGSMTVSVTREHEVLAFLETEKEWTRTTNPIEPGEVIRALRKNGIPHLEERHMVFTGHEYTREISDGMYGNMWYRVFGYRIGWSAWSVLSTCRQVEIATGIANVPARFEGWRYWESKHPSYKGRRLPWK
ncbi:hypothetical protein AB0L44_01060 [Nonomuraea wenchangensis]|uniref:hypothetical protein n=2 Tax=Nonomuraea wenchangensis TaxID=568860 RepID=UPI00343BA578